MTRTARQKRLRAAAKERRLNPRKNCPHPNKAAYKTEQAIPVALRRSKASGKANRKGGRMGRDTRPYITVTNELFRHPKWTCLPNDKCRLYLVELWGHCNEFRTDGLVAKHVLNAKGPAVAKALIGAGWVEATDDPQLFYMHDYLAHQPSKVEIEERIANKKTAGQLGGHTQWHVKRNKYDPTCQLCIDGVA